MCPRSSDQPSDAEVIAALQRVASVRGVVVHPRCQRDMMLEGFDVVSACELVAECDKSELVKSEPSNNPDFDDWIVELRVELEDNEALYIKVALRPGFQRGTFLSFKTSTD